MSEQEIPRVTPQEVKRRLDQGEAMLILDVRSLAAYERSHLPGSISIPVKEVEDRAGGLPRDRTILCY